MVTMVTTLITMVILKKNLQKNFLRESNKILHWLFSLSLSHLNLEKWWILAE